MAANNGNADVIKLLLEAGALIEAKDTVSKRISICTCVCVRMCVCVIFLHHSVVLFYSSILLLWYVGYDDFISMSNVFVLIIIFIFILASDSTSKEIVIIKSITKTLLTLMKSSYPTYHNNKI